MVWLILKEINPTIQVVISNLNNRIEQAILHKSSYNVTVILDKMHKNLEGIMDYGSTHYDYLCHMFRAMMTSTNVFLETLSS